MARPQRPRARRAMQSPAMLHMPWHTYCARQLPPWLVGTRAAFLRCERPLTAHAPLTRLAKKYHPDTNKGDPQAEARFQEAQKAYETLRDPEKRRVYDQAPTPSLSLLLSVLHHGAVWPCSSGVRQAESPWLRGAGGAGEHGAHERGRRRI